LWLLRPAYVIAGLLGAAACLFFVYFVRTINRNLTRVELGEKGIRIKGAFDSWISWDNLRLVRLDYFTTRSDRSGGWMQLELCAERRSISLDSHIGGFVEITSTVVREAFRRGLQIDERTLANMSALGVAVAVPEPAE